MAETLAATSGDDTAPAASQSDCSGDAYMTDTIAPEGTQKVSQSKIKCVRTEVNYVLLFQGAPDTLAATSGDDTAPATSQSDCSGDRSNRFPTDNEDAAFKPAVCGKKFSTVT